MIEELVSKIEDAGVMDNTYIFFTSDNGFHINQHRMSPGKKCAFETDIGVPFVVRGPNVPAGVVTDVVSSHIDLAPTIMQLAGHNPRKEFDGGPIDLSGQSSSMETKKEHTQVEFWGTANVKGLGHQPNTYKAVRLISSRFNLLYTVWCTDEREFYDMTVR